MIWVAATLIAAAAQTARNAAQAGLTVRIGTVGATAVRFVFGLPFALAALVVASLSSNIPALNHHTIAFSFMGALAQIGATAFMLVTMRGKSFGVATALMKTEPVTLAVIGALILAEPLGASRLCAIAIATTGVVLASGAAWSRAGTGAIITGVTAGALFGLSAIGFRGAILALPDGDFVIRSIAVLALTLSIQSVVMLVWMALFQRAALREMMRAWRSSLTAGALGAFASLFWFIGFALTPAAKDRKSVV